MTLMSSLYLPISVYLAHLVAMAWQTNLLLKLSWLHVCLVSLDCELPCRVASLKLWPDHNIIITSHMICEHSNFDSTHLIQTKINKVTT